MKSNIKNIFFIFVSFIFTIPIFSEELSPSDYNKLDPHLSLIIDRPELKPLLFKTETNVDVNKISMINILLKTSLTKTELKQLGIKVYSKIGDIVTASATTDNIVKLAKHISVSYIQASKTVSIKNDVSMSEIKATNAKQQYNLTGKNVIIGIIDTGIDWRHLDFRNTDGTTRIKALLDLSDPGDTDGDGDLDGPDQFGGTLHTEQEINNALNGNGTVNETDVVGHGTHVAGSAAGNGRATGNGVPAYTYVGVAPEADLVIIKGTRVHGSNSFTDVDYINGLSFIDSVANALNKPYVCNLSLGGSLGPHDGKDLSEQAIDNLVGPGKQGKAVVISAGNDGDANIHASGTFGNGVTNIETKFMIPSYTPNSSSVDDYVVFEGWYKSIFNYSVKLVSPEGNIYGPVSNGNEFGNDTNDGAIFISNARGGASNLNGDKQVLIQIYDYSSNNTPKEGEWKVIFIGAAGRFDLWLSGSSMEAELSSNIDHTMIVGTPGTSFNSITVGAYITKKQWVDLDGNGVQINGITIGDAANFSSQGPTRDGRVKPEISAPGQMIAASYSRHAIPTNQFSMYVSGNAQLPNAYICKDNQHAVSQGTSFSAPHISGAVALAFESDPTKDAFQIRQAMISTARKDSYTGSEPNSDIWGFGKIDVLATLQTVSVDNPEIETNIVKSIELHQNYPNPFNPTTLISYSLNTNGSVQLGVFNLLGQKIRTLVNCEQNIGIHKIEWNGKDDSGKSVSSGIYFYKLSTDDYSISKKMILLP